MPLCLEGWISPEMLGEIRQSSPRKQIIGGSMTMGDVKFAGCWDLALISQLLDLGERSSKRNQVHTFCLPNGSIGARGMRGR